MLQKITFGSWLKGRRKALDLTQKNLARRVNCSVETIYKIEAGKRRPSKQIATLLGEQLGIADSERQAFIQFARSSETVMMLNRQQELTPWRSRFVPDNNLPLQLNSFIGREDYLADITAQLRRENVRLLTLLGPPGMGKTRLSIHLGEALLADFIDGVFFIALAEVHQPEQVVLTIAETLDILLKRHQTPLESLKDYLYERQMLLILDNFEQLLDAAPLVSDILVACPLVKIVVTSRAPLRISGERQYPLEALALPAKDMDFQELKNFPSVRLFVERAQAILPKFELTDTNAMVIAELCRRLDGLPLAIEIVSARLNLLRPEEMLNRLQGALLLDSAGLVDADPRHHTLNQAIAWSYDLLSEADQLFFRRLGVFVGGFTLEAAEAITQPERDILDALDNLVNMNLLKRDNNQPRFMMLQTIATYARYQLEKSAALETMQQAHAAYFYQFALSLENGIGTGDQVEALDYLETEHRNLLAALDYFYTHEAWAEGLDLAGALFEFWVYHNHLSTGLDYATKFLIATEQNQALLPQRARLLNGASMMSYFIGDFPSIGKYAQQALAAATEVGSDENISFACLSLGMGNGGAGHFDKARRYLQQALAAAQRAASAWLLAGILNGFGEVARSQGQYEQALAHFEESLRIGQDNGYIWLLAHIYDNMGHTYYSQGKYDLAQSYCQKSLEASIHLRDERGIATCLEKLGGIAIVQRAAEQAAQFLGAAEAIRDRKNTPIEGMDLADYQVFVEQVRESLDDRTFEDAWQKGRQLSLAQVIDMALEAKEE